MLVNVELCVKCGADRAQQEGCPNDIGYCDFKTIKVDTDDAK